MDNTEVRRWLDDAWHKVLETGAADSDPISDRLVNSTVVSIRYAVITQLLGKIADPCRSLMYLQSGDQNAGAWNARSFCDSVVVPWVSENHDVLGTSAEPYASKPLRRPWLERDMPNVRDKAEWTALFDFFDPIDQSVPDDLEKAFIQCLESVARRLAKQSFKPRYPIWIITFVGPEDIFWSKINA